MDRFWSKVAVGEPAECWLWRAGSKTRKGYGIFKHEGFSWLAHRMAFVLHYGAGALPHGAQVLHSCDNPQCCNPSHLRAGTPAQNMQDKAARGRGNQPKGEHHPHRKLTFGIVRAIRKLRAEGRTCAQIAAALNTPRAATSDVLAGRTWAHVPPRISRQR